MDKSEAERLVVALQRQRPNMKAKVQFNGMTQAYEVAINGDDPRGVRVWLKSPVQTMRYIAWLDSQG